MNILWKRTVISFLLFTFTHLLFSQEKSLFEPFLTKPMYQNASVGIYIKDLEQRKTIVKLNENQSLIPASTLKLITTATTFSLFKSSHQFKTLIYYSGAIDSLGTLQGNIIIKGQGDPCLGSHRAKSYYVDFMQKWVVAVKESGIKQIEGSVLVDESYFSGQPIPASWNWGDIGNYYGAGSHALNIYENIASVYFKTNNKGDSTKIIKTSPEIHELSYKNNVKGALSKRDNAYIYGAPFQNNRVIEGTLPQHQDSFRIKGAIPDPGLLAKRQFEHLLNENNIEIHNQPFSIEKKVEIHTTHSPLLQSILSWTNFHSINLFAEVLLKHIGRKVLGEGSSYTGTRALISFWQKKGINTNGMFIHDGSGLSRSNAITAKNFIDILENIPYKEKFTKTLPISGKSGTLRRFCSSPTLTGKIHGKSGTMSRVKCYSGYIEYNDNPNRFAFAILVNNFNGNSSTVKKDIENLLQEFYLSLNSGKYP